MAKETYQKINELLDKNIEISERMSKLCDKGLALSNELKESLDDDDRFSKILAECNEIKEKLESLHAELERNNKEIAKLHNPSFEPELSVLGTIEMPDPAIDGGKDVVTYHVCMENGEYVVYMTSERMKAAKSKDYVFGEGSLFQTFDNEGQFNEWLVDVATEMYWCDLFENDQKLIMAYNKRIAKLCRLY